MQKRRLLYCHVTPRTSFAHPIIYGCDSTLPCRIRAVLPKTVLGQSHYARTNAAITESTLTAAKVPTLLHYSSPCYLHQEFSPASGNLRIRPAFANLQTRPACSSFVPTAPKSPSLAYQLRDFNYWIRQSAVPSDLVSRMHQYPRFPPNSLFRAHPPALSHKRYRGWASGSVMAINSDRHFFDTLHDVSTSNPSDYCPSLSLTPCIP